jgi:ubiquinone/menaquinone biosynthesis C-methylase UbiE
MTVEPVSFLDPATRRDYLSWQHVERYRFASQRLPSHVTVLDIACGAGYGAAILERHGCRVVAGDYDLRALRHSREKAGVRAVVQADARRLGLRSSTFDAITCFETIEHVVEGEALLREMRRVLRPGGVLICSTPNIRYTVHPRYHLKEYEPEEFFALVESVFGDVERYAQYFTARDYLLTRARKNLLIRAVRVGHAWLGSRLGARHAPSGSATPVADSAEASHSYYAVHPWGSMQDRVRCMVAVTCKTM